MPDPLSAWQIGALIFLALFSVGCALLGWHDARRSGRVRHADLHPWEGYDEGLLP